MTIRIYGHKAMELAEEFGLPLHKAADPIEDERRNISLDEAREIAREDAGLLYVELPDLSWHETTYDDGCGNEYPAVAVYWDDLNDWCSRVLGHQHEGNEDALVTAALAASGAPAWVADAEWGWTDEHEWGVYRKEAA